VKKSKTQPLPPLLQQAYQAGKYKPNTWFNKLSAAQQKEIEQAVKALPDSGVSMISLIRVIQKKFNVKVRERSMRNYLDDLKQ
jgi:transposase